MRHLGEWEEPPAYLVLGESRSIIDTKVLKQSHMGSISRMTCEILDLDRFSLVGGTMRPKQPLRPKQSAPYEPIGHGIRGWRSFSDQ